jgi:glycosyltransferase involved in cell wall biosynthesis
VSLVLSVVVPAHRSPRELARCIAALRASDLPAEQWELIVVDDASEDSDTTEAASAADRVVVLGSPPSGPARARNVGVAEATSGLVAFVDADVLVHPDALQRILRAFDDPLVAATFGSYDDEPAAPGVVSQFRNLLHHRVHQRNAGDVESFWAGIGAVRRTAFEEVGGFDENTFRRPEMEDVELGYRLRDAGYRIVLHPAIQGTHLKRWTLSGMLSSDFSRRGVPWARLLVERDMLLTPRGLSLGASERASAVVSFTAAIAALAAVLVGSPYVAIAGALLFALFVTANIDLFSWFAARRGRAFAIAAVPLHFLYSVNAVAALLTGTVAAFLNRRNGRGRYRRRQ